ncbi:hypothetical protein GCM10010289_85740 [Streptomyces violascens]|nr:hypothetical protein GCM10010289_85740 [Streptomyces violascens]
MERALLPGEYRPSTASPRAFVGSSGAKSYGQARCNKWLCRVLGVVRSICTVTASFLRVLDCDEPEHSRPHTPVADSACLTRCVHKPQFRVGDTGPAQAVACKRS